MGDILKLENNNVETAIEVLKTPWGAIAIGIAVLALFIFLFLVAVLGLEITFHPFTIKARPRKSKRENIQQQQQLQHNINKFDLDFLIDTIKDAYQLYESSSKDIHDKYNQKLHYANEKYVSSLVNDTINEYIDLLSKKSSEQSLVEESSDVLQLYLEKDIGSVLLNELKEFYDEDLTQAEVENKIETSISKIVAALKRNLLKYAGIIDKECLTSIYKDPPRFLANTLKDAFKDFSSYAKNEQDDIIKLLNEQTNRCIDKINNHFIVADTDNNDNSTVGGDQNVTNTNN
jgi:hypothetical protein